MWLVSMTANVRMLTWSRPSCKTRANYPHWHYTTSIAIATSSATVLVYMYHNQNCCLFLNNELFLSCALPDCPLQVFQIDRQ